MKPVRHSKAIIQKNSMVKLITEYALPNIMIKSFPYIKLFKVMFTNNQE